MLDTTNFVTTPYEGGDVTVAHVVITVDSIKALLTHNPESMGIEIPAGKGSRIPEAEVEAEAGAYRDADGNCCLKGEAFRAALIGAASAWKGKARRSMKAALSHVVIVEELVRLQNRDGTPITSYIIDARRAIVQRQGIIRRRPRFEIWSCTFTVEYDPKMTTAKMIVDIMDDAGSRMGVGDYRPIRNGPFGRFRVREYSIAKTD